MQSNRTNRYYSILGIEKGASKSEVREAYLKRTKVVHPDRFDQTTQPDEWRQANDMLSELNVAYQTILAELETDPTNPNRWNIKFDGSDEPSEETNNRQSNHRPSPTIPSGIIKVGDLPDSVLNQLRNRQKGLIENQLAIKSKRHRGYVLKTVLIVFWTLALGWATDRFEWTSIFQIPFLICSVIIGMISVYNGMKLWFWFHQKLKPGIIVTPLHLVVIDEAGLIRYKSLELFNNITTKKYKSFSVNSGLVAAIDFVNETILLNLNSRKQAHKLLEVLTIFAANLRDAKSPELHDYITSNNDFVKVSGFARFDENARRHGQPSVAMSILIGAILGGSIFATCLHLNSIYRPIDVSGTGDQDSVVYVKRSPLIPPKPIQPEKTPQPVIPKSHPDANYAAPTTGYLEHNGATGKIPFKFHADGGGIDFYIRIEDDATSSLVYSLFVRSGETLRVLLPDGMYRLKYAAGADWSSASQSFRTGEIQMNDPTRYAMKILPGSPAFGKSIEIKIVSDPKSNSRRIAITAFDLVTNGQ